MSSIKSGNIKYFSNEILKEIKHYDSVVELIGYVDELGDIDYVGPERKRLLKFFLNNGQGSRIQIKAWKNQIDRILPELKCNEIIHLDGVLAKSVANIFNKGTIPYELTIQSNTWINYLGQIALRGRESVGESPLIKFDQICNTKGNFEIQGFMKTMFTMAKNDKYGTFLFTNGSITDGLYKLDIRIRKNDGNDIFDFQKGEKVQVKGQMNFGETNYLDVTSSKDIKKIDGTKLPMKEIIRACKKIKRICDSENTQSSKRYKSN